MQLTLPLGRRQRATVLSLAAIAGVAFLVFITRVFLLGPPEPPLRTCRPSEIYFDVSSSPPVPLSFTGAQRKYHFIMESLVEERMNLYEGTTLLACNAPTVEEVIPAGQFATEVADVLRQTNFDPAPPDDYFSPSFTYADFEKLLTEFFRTYDCHLFAAQTSPALLGAMFRGEGTDQATPYSGVTFTQEDVLEQERIRARSTLDRLLFTLRSSEQYLPLHASLRCLQRGGADVRNAMALLSDANQCLYAKLGNPETSLLQ